MLGEVGEILRAEDSLERRLASSDTAQHLAPGSLLLLAVHDSKRTH
jgi:hypothetical protein